MPGALSKYTFNGQPGANQVVGRRPSDGLPVRGNGHIRLDMRGDDADQLPVTCDYKAQMFRMWIHEEQQLYVQILDHASNGEYVVAVRRELLAEKAETDLPGQEMKIWLEWRQYYVLGEPPRQNLL